MKAANIEANVFYRRYGSMENLYDRLAKQYDFWINDAIDVSSLNIFGPKKFFAETFIGRGFRKTKRYTNRD